MIKKDRLKPYKLFKNKVLDDGVGGKYEDFEQEPITILAEVWPAGGEVQAQIYGERLSYIFNLNAELDTNIDEKDGICIKNTDKPDYKVKSLQRYTKHLVCVLEAIK